MVVNFAYVLLIFHLISWILPVDQEDVNFNVVYTWNESGCVPIYIDILFAVDLLF